MADRKKGTVTPLAESISVTDAVKVAKAVAEAIEVQRKQLQTLQNFSDENQSLSELVLELPDMISYNIMVPFGKAAFMPGRFIHTNEFMVLLGEGYYAERSAKQAVEILERRGEFLQSKIEAINAHIADLQAEASFASNTAAEAAGGVVEIREEYVAPPVPYQRRDSIVASSAGEGNSNDDAEHDRIMARLVELEMAEADNMDSEDDEDDELEMVTQRLQLDSDDGDENNSKHGDVDEEFEEYLENGSMRGSLPDIASTSRIVPQNARGRTSLASSPSTHESNWQENRLHTRKEGSVLFEKDGAGSAQGVTVAWQLNAYEKGTSGASAVRNQLPPRPPTNREPTPQHRAFTGAVMERSVGDLPVPPVFPDMETSQNRPVSKFKLRKS